MSKSLTIGSRSDCDLLVDIPSVSGRHCRLTADEEGYLIEDLGSTNGTYVNGMRISDRIRVSLLMDSISLGSHPFPVELVLARFVEEAMAPLAMLGSEMIVGRNPGCDHMIDLPMVSARHARLLREGDRILIEDLRSSNGTFVNGVRIDGPTVVKSGDLIGLGSHTLKLEAGPPAAIPVDRGEPDSAPGSAPLPTIPGEPTGWAASPGPAASPSSAGWGEPLAAAVTRNGARLAALLVQAPLLAFLLLALISSRSPAPLLFGLALTAIWFGLSAAVLTDLIGPSLPRLGDPSQGWQPLLSRLLVLVGLCSLQCLMTWLIVAHTAGLRAPGGAALAFLVLASAVGLALGLIFVASVPRTLLPWIALPAAMACFGLLGGAWQPLPRMPAAAGTFCGFVPTRWAFEGLLLLESDRLRDRQGPGASGSRLDPELAETYFPAETERMGIKADAMALVAMLIGLSAAALFICSSAGPDPSTTRVS